MNAPECAPDRQKILTGVILLGLLLLALALRLYGIEWDARQLFHPDERQVLMVVERLRLPAPGEWPALLTPASPLNPGFFAYGSLPLYLLKIVSAALALIGGAWADPDRLCLIGRGLAALFDTGTVLLVFGLGRRLYPGQPGLRGTTTGLLAALLLALAVLHVQAAHFYTVDPILAFLTTLTVSLMVPVAERGAPAWRWGLLAGVVWGLALATKATAVLLVVPVGVTWGLGARRGTHAALGTALTVGAALVTLALAEPYAFIDAPTFVQHTLNEIAVARGTVIFPYTVQYLGTTPWLYPAGQLLWWGLGVPLGLTAGCGVVWLIQRAWRRRRPADLVILAWMAAYFVAVGSGLAQPMRYMLPLTPFLCLAAAALLANLKSQISDIKYQIQKPVIYPILAIGYLTIALTALYAISFVAGVYGREHPWLTASAWIYRHVPPGSTILVETWEHGLPVEMMLDGQYRSSGEYVIREIDLHGAQDAPARARLAEALAGCDAVILASRRGYLPLTRQAAEYPLAARFYHQLFGGGLGFELATSAATGPALGALALADDPIAAAGLPAPPGLARPGEYVLTLPLADESLIVYDHPLPLVWIPAQVLSPAELDRLLEPSVRP
ncbi:MAG: glycosyltransferase family 39 protein [Chloroflexi bacterium]|nr:glycosyltransferase family 39 protein [Chloroflexota bacterium]MBU1751427.1 glycosyltransferase family 39 protein [Chloroflexota bacterium]